MTGWSRPALVVTFAAAAMLMVTMARATRSACSFSPINSSTGLGVVTISFALAIAQFVWGAVQPLAGAVADRHGPRPVLAAGLVLLALGTALTPLMSSGMGLVLVLGLLTAVGSGSASFSVLLGAAAQRLPPQARGTASGVINAGGSFGQFVFAPITQKLIQGIGWPAPCGHSRWRCSPRCRSWNGGAGRIGSHKGGEGAWSAVRGRCAIAAIFFSTRVLHLRFPHRVPRHAPAGRGDLCGLPPTVASWSLAIIGLANIAGSLLAGAAVSRYRSKLSLALMYGSRAVLILLYLAAPKTPITFYFFAFGLGLTWLSTVPPTRRSSASCSASATSPRSSG
jgi:MFS family permease